MMKVSGNIPKSSGISPVRSACFFILSTATAIDGCEG
jgi:hypothetical protein